MECSLKKCDGVFCKRPREKYAVIRNFGGRIGVKRACKLLNVSRSGYYAWLKIPDYEKPDIIGVLVKKIFYDSGRTYGIR